MLTLERQNGIYEYLKLHKSASVSELSRKFFIGETTIRRDLEKLERENLVKRSYGGAILLESPNAEIPITIREKEQSEAKSIIGKLAANCVSDGDIIIMDSSTTTYSMIPYLTSKANLTIITNGVKAVTAAGQILKSKIYCTGGRLRENSQSLVGPGAADTIKNFSAQKLFFSCRAISDTLVAMDNCENEAELRKIMMSQSDKVYLLCDSSKFSKTAFYRICSLDSVDVLISDKAPTNGIVHEALEMVFGE